MQQGVENTAIDLAAWCAQIGFNYYHACCPQVEKQCWTTSHPWVARWGVKDREWHTPGAQRLHGSHHFVTDTAVHSPHLAQAEGERWGWQTALPLVWDQFSSEGDSRWTLKSLWWWYLYWWMWPILRIAEINLACVTRASVWCFSVVKHDKKDNLYNCKAIPLLSFKTAQLVCVGMNSVIKSRIYLALLYPSSFLCSGLHIRIIELVLAG